MRKLLKAVLVAVLPLCLIAGCSSNENKETTGTISIYFVRHGKTMFNNSDLVQGWADSPLIEKGEKQADAVGRGLKDVPFTTAYTSDLGRARATAKRILDQNAKEKPVLTELVGLREWFYGGYEGKAGNDMWKPIFESQGLVLDEEWSQYPALVEKLGDEGIANAIAANDETNMAEDYAAITKRSQEAMDTIVKETAEKGNGNVLAVSSGSEIPTILELIAPGQYKGEPIDNCSVTIVDYKDGKYTIRSIGDNSYVEKGMK